MLSEIKHKFLSTEKTIFLREKNKIVVSTNHSINQKDIVFFIEQKYDIKILKINSLSVKGKTKVRRKVLAKMPDRKKFYLTVDNISKFE